MQLSTDHNTQEVEEFLSLILGDLHGNACLGFLRTDGHMAHVFAAYPDQLGDLVETALAEGQAHHAYFTPALYRVQRRKKVDALDRVSALWADLDACDPREVTPRPSIAVQTSPGRYQGYWLLTSELPTSEAENLNRRIAYAYRDQGCDVSGWPANKLLRVPGTPNHKYADKPIVEILWSEETRYSPADFEHLPEPPKRIVRGDVELPEQEPVSLEYFGRVDGFVNQLNERISEGKFVKGGAKGHSFSDARFNLLCSFLEIGLPPTMMEDATRGCQAFDKDENLDLDLNAALGKHNHAELTCEQYGECESARIEKSVTEVVAPAKVFTIFEPDQHAEPVPPMEWLIKGIWPKNSYGPLGGAKKTFKSYNSLALSIAVGTGLPYLHEFEVQSQGPVFYFIGEGGYKSWRRRYQRMCAAYGIAPEKGNVYATSDIAPVDSKEFAEMVKQIKGKLNPPLFILDPMYAYHPRNIEAQNLYDRGRMLANLHSLMGEETSLMIPDHFRKSGVSLDLDEIGQSGMSQWADSWILQIHRKPYDRRDGTAFLTVEYGSREGYGRRLNLDLTVGRFNEDTGDHEGPIEWQINVSDESDELLIAKGAEVHSEESLHKRLEALLDNPAYKIEENREFSKAQGVSMLRDLFKIGKSAAYERWNDLIKNGTLVEIDKNKFKVRPTLS